MGDAGARMVSVGDLWDYNLIVSAVLHLPLSPQFCTG